jgi:hypothetical protein
MRQTTISRLFPHHRERHLQKLSRPANRPKLTRARLGGANRVGLYPMLSPATAMLVKTLIVQIGRAAARPKKAPMLKRRR